MEGVDYTSARGGTQPLTPTVVRQTIGMLVFFFILAGCGVNALYNSIVANQPNTASSDYVTPSLDPAPETSYAPSYDDYGGGYGRGGRPKDVYVHSYTRSNGTHVNSYYRSSPGH